MNNISSNQNNQHQLELLFSQRALYSSAKKYFSWRTFIAILIAIVGPLLTSLNNSVSTYSVIFVVAYLVLDNLVFEKIEKSKKETAAKLQETFDTNVLDLPWNSIVVGKKPDAGIVGSILSKNKGADYSLLRNWYAPEVSEVNLDAGRFLCQRTNAWWDSKLRTKYLVLLYGVSFLVIVALVTLGVILDLTVPKFLLGVLLPMVPLIELLGKQIKEHYNCDTLTSNLRDSLDTTLDSIISGENIPSPKVLSRTYQDEIYRHRSSCPMVFDWVYWLFRDDQEVQMSFNITDKVNSIKASH